MSSRLRAALRDADHVTFQRSFFVRYVDTHERHHLGPVCVSRTVDNYALPRHILFHLQKLNSSDDYAVFVADASDK